MRCVTHTGSVSLSLCPRTPGTSSDLSEPGPTLIIPGTDQMTPHSGLDVHFSFQKIPSTRSRCGSGTEPGWGTWTLHTQGTLGGGRQFNNWSESQKRGELVSGGSSRQWGVAGAMGFRHGPRDWPVRLTAALLGPISGAGVTWPGLAICVDVHAALGILRNLNSEAAGPGLLVSLNLFPRV